MMTDFPPGAISEVFGAASCGKTALLHHFLAEASARGEFCAMVDGRGAFDPHSAAAAGVNLGRLLWLRGHARLDSIFKATDMILHNGGFGVVVLDLCETPARDLNSIPLSYWYRFRLAVENTPTRLLVMGDQPLVKSCARVQIEVRRGRFLWRGPVFEGIDFAAESRKHAARLAG